MTSLHTPLASLRYLTVAEIAAATSKSEKTVYRAIWSGRLRANQDTPKGGWRASPQAVTDWVEGRAPRRLQVTR